MLDRVGLRAMADLLPLDPPAEAADGVSPADRLTQALEAASAALQRLRALRLPPFAQGPGVLSVFLAIAALVGPPAWWLFGGPTIAMIILTSLLTAGGGVAVALWLRGIGRRQTAAALRPLLEQVRDAEELCRRCMNDALAAHKLKQAEVKRVREEDSRRAAEKQAPLLAACRTRREVDLPKITIDADQRLLELEQKSKVELAEALRAAERLTGGAQDRHELAQAVAASANETRVAENHARYDQMRRECARGWEAGFTAMQAELLEIRAAVDAACPAWDSIGTDAWRPPQSVPPAIRFGTLSVDLRPAMQEALGGARIEDSDDFAFELPAILNFPEGSSLYVKTQGAGRQAAVRLMQVVMLRMLTAIPPGKLRLTIVDPVGLGQNFASFMHLADHDEALVAHRIWTEPAQIEQRLADLTEHIETVIQKYLRNEFPTIRAYNEAAGEVAEPFRVLVVANYPAGFTEASARRLLSIATSGPRCGVHVLMSVDTKLPPIPGVSLADLQKNAVVFSTSGDQVVWHDEDFKEVPLTIDALPAERSKQVLQAVGAAAVASKRVEVPFEAIAPTDDQYWKSDSRRGIDVPLGRVGATRLQHLRLGQGTSQHVLIAGKTGSGKSTLLHALITNAALRYSPEELELYLIDFKKGVEFKTYVTHELPHARVVAIESEREFGLSVMQRLDAEMRMRGEMFRQQGVQDIGGFRDAGGQLPRILFIVDEFQEFFVEDDKIAQEASLLLDRLVRQGRAFGIHVHLGSQTLGGAYSLARTTLGQMAVRIALQCSEADAHLILSEENSAARLLSRPGEAIYNDANGLVEGNHPFQVVWLPDDRREVFLDQVSRLARERPAERRRQPIVFEGTRPADLEKSESIAAWLHETATGAAAGGAHAGPRAWLGEPLAIEQATSVSFARRGGANLLMLGQNDEAAAGMMCGALVSLAAATAGASSNGHPAAAPLVFLNGGPADRDYAALLHKLPTYLHGRLKWAGATDTAAVVAEMAADVAARQASTVELPARFFFVFDLARLRDLRRQEDDFSFSRSAEATRRIDQQFTDILRDGPAVGVHTIVWCDTLTNFQRMLDRQALKEFETRVLLQMSAADSSLLIDTPGAASLGRHRALLHREDEGRLEKFRPFSAPSEAWAAEMLSRFGVRTATGADAVEPVRGPL